MPVRVIGPKDPRAPWAIDTTSHSRTWSRALSPFFLGPVNLWEGAPAPVAFNVENAWQYSKVYKFHLEKDGNPGAGWAQWAKEGFETRRARRYPMGKGVLPEYSWWEGEKLSYIEARKKIYVPLYGRAVVQTEAFQKLAKIYRESGDIVLWDFDGYDHMKLGKTLKEVFTDPCQKMGHAFVLAMLLEKYHGPPGSWEAQTQRPAAPESTEGGESPP